MQIIWPNWTNFSADTLKLLRSVTLQKISFKTQTSKEKNNSSLEVSSGELFNQEICVSVCVCVCVTVNERQRKTMGRNEKRENSV